MPAEPFPWQKLMTITEREPPSCPPGWEPAPPDFVGVGTQRGGTSRWFALIGGHPRIVHKGGKELHYFDRQWNVGHADPADYARYFPRPPGHICGEWTPEYMLHFWAPPLLAAAAPDAKLLVSLRDPVERFLSALSFNAKNRLLNYGTPLNASARGLYSHQLSYLLRHFPRRQLLVLQYERCVTQPRAELRRTFEFLGVDPDFKPDGMRKRINSAKPLMPHPHDRAALIAYYEADVQSLVATFPEIDLTLWPNFAHLA